MRVCPAIACIREYFVATVPCMHASNVHRYAGNLAELKLRWQTRVILFDEWSFPIMFKALSRLIVFKNVEFLFFFFLSLVSLRVQNSSNRWRCLNFLLVVLSLAELLHWICYFLYKRKCDFSFLNLSTNHRKKYKWWFISLLRVVITRSIIHGLSRVSTLEHQM